MDSSQKDREEVIGEFKHKRNTCGKMAKRWMGEKLMPRDKGKGRGSEGREKKAKNLGAWIGRLS